jgi:hypothetical protein
MADYEENEETGSDTDSDEDEEILEASREGLQARIEEEASLRQLMRKDLRFATLDQWPAEMRSARENDLVNGPRPCLTVDQINQYLTQVSNDMAANRPAIKVRPVDDFADPGTAEIFQGLIRHIEDQSSAHIAYQTSGSSAVKIGLGFIRVLSDYSSPDSFEQELVIGRVPDTFTVYLGEHKMPDGSDADEAWVYEAVPIKKFKREFPKAKVDSAEFNGLGVTPTWRDDETVIVCEYFYKKFTPAKTVFLADGRSMFQDEFDKMPDPKPEVVDTRDSQKTTVMWCKHTGCEVLEKRELKGKYIPVVEEIGKEEIVDGKRILWGLVRPAIDSLLAFNYWISAMTEKMALSPKTPFIGAVGQFKTASDKWATANTTNHAFLEFDPIDVNGNALPAPRRQEPVQMEAAMAQMLIMLQNNVKASLGMYKASIGDTDSQQSGRAILALKKESDTGTSHFGANQAISITHVGRILVDLIPHYYDTRRILRILGEDGKADSVTIDPKQPESKRDIHDVTGKKIKSIYNLGVGKFDVTVTVGPGYTTSRQEAATIMTELAQGAKDPASAAIMQYGAVKSSDFHGSEEITRMLKATLPPQILQAEESQAEIPPEALQKIQQLSQQMQMMQQKGQELMQENQQLKSGAQINMAKISVDSEAKKQAFELDKQIAEEKARLAREEFEFQKQLDIDKAQHQAWLDEQKVSAEHSRKKTEFEFNSSMKQQEAAVNAEQSAMPQTLDTLGKMTQVFSNIDTILQQQTVLQERTAETLQAMLTHQISPKQVGISNVRKDASGRITGATVNSTIQ